jgi:hypothetical protein
MPADAKELLSASIRVIRASHSAFRIPHSAFRIPHLDSSAFCILPSLRRASPSATYNQNLDPKRCVSVTASNASTYQISHSERFDNPFGHSTFQNPRFAPQPADYLCSDRATSDFILPSSFFLLPFPPPPPPGDRGDM